jgi:hypothetical protein
MTTNLFWRHAGILGGLGVIIALALGAAFMSIARDQRPRHVPVAVVGRSVPDRAAAVQAIRERAVYGAVVGPELLIASAANNGVANFLRRAVPAARVTDVRALPKDDATGLDIALLVQILLVGGSIAVVGIGRVLPRVQGDPRRGIFPIGFLAAYAVLFALALTLIVSAFGVGGEATFVDKWLAMTLISAGVATSTAALVALIGPAGSGVAGVLYFLLGAQISGAGAAPEFLPSFWSGLGQTLPGGAGTSLLRSVFYFPGAPTGGSVAILAGYAAAGLLAVVGLSIVRGGRSSSAVATAAASATPAPTHSASWKPST